MATELVTPKKVKNEPVGYKIVVSPASFYIACWTFILLIPNEGEEQERLVLVKQLCDLFLDNNDVYSIYTMSVGDDEEFRGSPILGYTSLSGEESSDEFQWIIPPHHIRN